jgi:hypothetical protein
MEKNQTSRNMLEEAIADAKTVRESAIENAKLSLQEAFEPKLRSMIATQLEEMDKEEMEEELEEEMFDNEVEMDEDEIDLDEILAELETEFKDDLEEESEGMDLYNEKMETEESEMEDMEDMEGMEDEEDQIEVEDMTEEELKSFIESVIEDMIKAGELEAGHGEMEDMEDMENMEDMEDMEDEEELDLNELIYELKKEKKEIQLEKKLNEAYETIKVYKQELNEVNLLNAKLLYTNKIFKSKNLTETQKVKVLGAFDKATSVKEAKLVFETIFTSEEYNKTKSKPVMEGIIGGASKQMMYSKTEKQPIMESDQMIQRFQKLAGII